MHDALDASCTSGAEAPIAAQGTFVECASPAHVTLWLASVVLELVAAKEVHTHTQPYVRRSALIAASQACFYRLSSSSSHHSHGGQLVQKFVTES